jgi:hypothetical protein
MVDFTLVEESLQTAKGIAYDTCHKIYILMDDNQLSLMHQYEYPQVISQAKPEDMLEKIKTWYAGSCSLKFVESVTTVDDNPNEGFISLIPQGAEDEGKCDDCLEYEANCLCSDWEMDDSLDWEDEDDEDE